MPDSTQTRSLWRRRQAKGRRWDPDPLMRPAATGTPDLWQRGEKGLTLTPCRSHPGLAAGSWQLIAGHCEAAHVGRIEPYAGGLCAFPVVPAGLVDALSMWPSTQALNEKSPARGAIPSVAAAEGDNINGYLQRLAVRVAWAFRSLAVLALRRWPSSPNVGLVLQRGEVRGHPPTYATTGRLVNTDHAARFSLVVGEVLRTFYF